MLVDITPPSLHVVLVKRASSSAARVYVFVPPGLHHRTSSRRITLLAPPCPRRGVLRRRRPPPSRRVPPMRPNRPSPRCYTHTRRRTTPQIQPLARLAGAAHFVRQLVFARLVVVRRTCQLLFACVVRLASEHLILRELRTSGDDDEAVGDRPVPLLLSIRPGLDDVNLVYYETMKMLYTFPQSVGIAGWRPSSSYHFVGVQGDGLFYLDPHHSRPAVPPRPRPTPSAQLGLSTSEPPASRAGLQEPRVGSLEQRAASPPIAEGELVLNAQRAEEDASGMARAEAAFYQCAHAPVVLRTFHCEMVRKMPLSGLDPYMLLGFVCRDEGEWVDLRRRTAAADLCDPGRAADVDDDDDMDLESVSDPEEEEAMDADDGEGSMRFFDEGPSSASHGVSSSASHTHASTHYHSNSNSTTSSARTRSEEADTEEDPVAPITPLPTTTRFDLSGGPKERDGAEEKDKAGSPFPVEDMDAGRENDNGDDPVPSPPMPAPAAVKKSKRGGGKSKEGKKKEEKKSKTNKAAAVPVPGVHYPFPVSAQGGASGGGQQQQERADERERERLLNVTVSPPPPAQGRSEGRRMHTAHARDGGRTQSGGVRGFSLPSPDFEWWKCVLLLGKSFNGAENADTLLISYRRTNSVWLKRTPRGAVVLLYPCFSSLWFPGRWSPLDVPTRSQPLVLVTNL
ncbi:peptidase family C54-domain-containing protein [Mycena rebaudengoi]|nr:peptidase family C54-domain-containing protein [Mycena rebaudengoi]